MPKRGNDNSQISKENYDDSCIRSTVEHGMTKASNEELKRRRTVSVSGNKKWSTLSSPGSSTKSSISTNPFASVQIGAASASANNNPFAAIQFGKASPAASASTTATSPAKITTVKPSPPSTHASFNNNVAASNADGKDRKMALLNKHTAIIVSNNMFNDNPEGLMDVINSEVESMDKIGWANIVQNYSAKKEHIRSLSLIAPKAETTLAATAKEHTNNVAPINDNPVMENKTTSNENKDEEEIYHTKARAYKDTIPSTGWKDFGTGAIKLLHNKSTDKYQLLLRNEQLGKPIINISIVKGMKVTNNKNFIMLVAVMDKTIGRESFMFKVGKSNVDAFMKHLNDIVK